MKATHLLLLLFGLFVVGCSSIVIEGQVLQPAQATATALAVSRASPTSTSDLAATAIEGAVRLTLTAAVPSPTNTPPPSSTATAEPTTAIPPTETPTPTATKKPIPRATVTPTGYDPFVGTWIAVDIYDGSNIVLTITRSNGGYNLMLVDDGASVCGKDEAGKPKFAMEVRSTATAQGNVLTGPPGVGTCLSDPPSPYGPVPVGGGLIYHASSDTLVDLLDSRIVFTRR